MAKSNKSKNMVTPIGKFLFVNLNSPDMYSGDPKWAVTLVLDPNDDGVQDFVNNVTAEYRELMRGVKRPQPLPIKENVDADGNTDGLLRMVFRTHAQFKDSLGNIIPNKIPVVDGSKLPIDLNEIVIGMGSLGRISFAMRAYDRSNKQGVTLCLNAVQVTNIVSGGLNGVDDFDAIDSNNSAAPISYDEDDDSMPF